MVFDRTAVVAGRRMQDFGLCDLKGIYWNSAKLRAKGYLVVAFISATDPNSAAVAKHLQSWVAISDKLTVAGLFLGERDEAIALVDSAQITYNVLWDPEAYVSAVWSVTAVPTVFVIDTQGIVLSKVVGNDPAALASAKDLLAETIQKADDAAAQAKALADASAAAAQPPVPAKA